MRNIVAKAVVEDKIVQQAVLWVLQCIYQQDFIRRQVQAVQNRGDFPRLGGTDK